MKASAIVAQLRAYCPSFANRVSGGIDWESIEKSGKLPPLSAYVVLTDEDADGSEVQNGTIQALSEQFDVCVVFAQAPGDEAGYGVGEQINAIRRELCRALIGWEPATHYAPVSYGGRQLLLNDRAKAVYRFSFITGSQLGSYDPDPDNPETWTEYELAGLPDLTGIDIAVDFIDPMVDKNLSPTGPDGRIEITIKEDL